MSFAEIFIKGIKVAYTAFAATAVLQNGRSITNVNNTEVAQIGSVQIPSEYPTQNFITDMKSFNGTEYALIQSYDGVDTTTLNITDVNQLNHTAMLDTQTAPDSYEFKDFSIMWAKFAGGKFSTAAAWMKDTFGWGSDGDEAIRNLYGNPNALNEIEEMIDGIDDETITPPTQITNFTEPSNNVESVALSANEEGEHLTAYVVRGVDNENTDNEVITHILNLAFLDNELQPIPGSSEYSLSSNSTHFYKPVLVNDAQQGFVAFGAENDKRLTVDVVTVEQRKFKGPKVLQNSEGNSEMQFMQIADVEMIPDTKSVLAAYSQGSSAIYVEQRSLSNQLQKSALLLSDVGDGLLNFNPALGILNDGQYGVAIWDTAKFSNVNGTFSPTPAFLTGRIFDINTWTAGSKFDLQPSVCPPGFSNFIDFTSGIVSSRTNQFKVVVNSLCHNLNETTKPGMFAQSRIDEFEFMPSNQTSGTTGSTTGNEPNHNPDEGLGGWFKKHSTEVYIGAAAVGGAALGFFGKAAVDAARRKYQERKLYARVDEESVELGPSETYIHIPSASNG